jgi:hypothetical protein
LESSRRTRYLRRSCKELSQEIAEKVGLKRGNLFQPCFLQKVGVKPKPFEIRLDKKDKKERSEKGLKRAGVYGRQETRERHSALKCFVFRLKIDASRLSQEKKDYLERLFLEKKWFRNAVVASENFYTFDYKTKTVKVKKQEAFEDREITVLSSQMRHSVIEEVQDNIKASSGLKKQRKKIERLKFLSRCNTVALKQSGITYRTA